MHGANGKNLDIRVPPGTIIYKNSKLFADLTKLGDKKLIAKGGKGGLGNTKFSTSTNRTPRQSTPGKDGESAELTLELKFIADVGLIGLPNSGKSTLISVISNAKPKIADYLFTTIEPNLAAVDHKKKRFIVADIPGLIEGSSGGKGLGDKFLKHTQRTKILVHLISSESQNPKRDYTIIRNELSSFDKTLTTKDEIVVISKSELLKRAGKINLRPDLSISSVTHHNINRLLDLIVKKLSEE